MKESIPQHNENIILLENNLHNNYNNINELFILYKDFINFIRLIKIYEINRWLILRMQYKELKNNITKNKKLYNNILKNYEILYTFMSTDDIETNNNKINNLKLSIDNNNYYMYNLQKEHKFISNKLITFIRNNSIYKINNINNEIKNIINNHYDKINNIKKINNYYKIIKYKIKNCLLINI